MEVMLIGVTLVSLALAAAMSIIAWRLFRQERERAAARVEALAALAFTTSAAMPRVTAHAASGYIPVDREPSDRTSEVGASRQEELDLRLQSSDLMTAYSLAPSEAAPSARLLPQNTAGATSVMFERPRPATGAGKRWLALAAIALVVAAGYTMMTALRSPEVVAAVAASRAPAAHPLELLSLRHSASGDSTFVVTGLVQNPEDGTLVNGVEAVVYLFDEAGRYFATGRAPLDVPRLSPGEGSPFVVAVQSAAGVARYRIGFRESGGGSVTHVDRRGELPQGTSGDALAAGASAPPDVSAVPLGASRGSAE
jgi:hypothetical protein